jgi:hypothetical protein
VTSAGHVHAAAASISRTRTLIGAPVPAFCDFVATTRQCETAAGSNSTSDSSRRLTVVGLTRVTTRSRVLPSASTTRTVTRFTTSAELGFTIGPVAAPVTRDARDTHVFRR